jgi:hypothetical protein
LFLFGKVELELLINVSFLFFSKDPQIISIGDRW